MLDKLIESLTKNGLAALGYVKFRGHAGPCFKFIQLMVETKLYQPDAEEWNYLTKRMVRDGGSN